MQKIVALASLLLCFAVVPAFGADKCEIECSKCTIECNQMLKYVKTKKGEKYARAKIAIEDCAQVCKLLEDLKKRKSPLVAQASVLCAEACKNSRTACEATDDPRLKTCIASCKSCEEACK